VVCRTWKLFFLVVRRVQRRSQCIREHRNWRILVSKKQGVSRGRIKLFQKGRFPAINHAEISVASPRV
jgi:hypothetical protein